MVYGYHRTSTKEQHLDRGIAEITKYCEEHNMKLEKFIPTSRQVRILKEPDTLF